MSVQNGTDRVLYSLILQAALEHSSVIEGECCNLLRRLHMAWGEYGTILLPLRGKEWSHSVRGAKTLVHFHRPRWHKFSLTRRYDCQSAPSAQWGNGARDRNLSRRTHYEVSLKRDCSFLSLSITSLVQTAASAVPNYKQSVWMETHFHTSSNPLAYWDSWIE